MRAGQGRRSPVLLAVLLLVLQAFIPAAAIAHDHPANRVVEVCTPSGVKSLRLPGTHHHGFGGLACEQCVIASLTALGVAAPPPIPAIARVEPARFLVRIATAHRGAGYLRPPSTGPPAQA